jgi:hypothetical protein
MVSEHSLHLKSQPTPRSADMSIDLAGNSILPQGLSQARRHAQHKPRFIEFACSNVEVCMSCLSRAKAYLHIGLSLCHARHEGRYSQAILGMPEEL